MILFRSAEALVDDPLELYSREPNCCLLTPTATLAEHLRHAIARQGVVVRPDSIVTLSRFVEPWVADLYPASKSTLRWLIREELRREPPAEFRALADSPGLETLLASLLEELSGADCTPELIEGLAPASVQGIYARLSSRLDEQGWYLRSRRLHLAAQRMRNAEPRFRAFAVTGFYSFTPSECDVLETFLGRPVAIRLEESSFSVETEGKLAGLGLLARRQEEDRAQEASSVLVAAPNMALEADEIARRILKEVASGRRYRELGVVLRRERPYAPLLTTTFRRYQIPARFYFQQKLRDHAVTRYLLSILEAAEQGWNYEALRRVLGSRYSGFGASARGDELSNWLLRHAPASGLPEALRRLERFTSWLHDVRTPEQWNEALLSLLDELVLPATEDRVSHEQALEWRNLAAAIRGWEQALEETARLLSCFGSKDRVSLAEFRSCLEVVLAEASLPASDQRRDVVHVIDAYEARQWRLPVIFICGLTERHFPQYHAEHPLLGDQARFELRKTGHTLRTSQERQQEESFLFQTACRAATEKLILSYPEANERGEELLRSLFLNRLLVRSAERAVAVRPRVFWPAPPSPPSGRLCRESLPLIRSARTSLSPTSIEVFLQCPFQFFASRLLRLEGPPPRPEERLDHLLQGEIIHRALAEFERSPIFAEELLTRLLEETFEQHHIPATCDTEQVRLALTANLKRFLQSAPLQGGRTLAVERPFAFKFGAFRLQGKIDHVLEVPQRGIVVIDYKYSSRQKIRDRIRATERGELVQGGLYLWAAQKLLQKRPAGILYCGLKGEISWQGWHIPILGWQDVGETLEASSLGERIQDAVQTAQAVAERILAGEFAPDPADRRKCGLCDFRDVCRVETLAASRTLAANASL
ncbi:MAG: exodeoxyribonuclease V subunit gamma [Bryobacteraceae bacterium]|nr:exodeoxyribonuclease V subunit gamma [Bryobacteraceae bacterium]MDW8378575.1 PD-(D/E)XK nuclease family protein [Bryobacterales bacterium]